MKDNLPLLIFNAGSSTLKFSLYVAENGFLPIETEPQLTGLLEKKNKDFVLKLKRGVKEELHSIRAKNLSEAMQQMSPFLPSQKDVAAIGHRVVHGGTLFTAPTLLNAAKIRKIKELSYLAPLHNPANAEGIEIAKKIFPRLPQVAVFDTAFHSQMPKPNIVYPGPYRWFKEGVRRFGFHGINHQYCMERVQSLIHKEIKNFKLITCHLGNGCSLAAIKNGVSIDTTMGFTPMEGLMMGTRSGNVDPGILFYLLNQKKHSAQELERVLNRESGLQGIAGSYDMREILFGVANQKPQAILAFEMFLHSLIKNIAMMAGSLGGVDLIAFSGGIGENAFQVREKTCEALSFLEINIDVKKNQNADRDSEISSKTSNTKVFVIKAKEDWIIAKETLNMYNCN